ncbi:L-2-hydroxyglutarate oxidase [Aliiglaciecola litoralis]|uniref:L-2-hydroxyglutarate oxidase n=1 Tax=Aliiglaciecola litoralis TaxID=582857 RepID=A0ABN1LKX1_9ALTE
MDKYDVTVIGAGIVGVATACEIKRRFPSLSVMILEKETSPAMHQTGRNSGVIHAGVYYQPGSLKARFCQQGLKDTIAFCRQHAIPFQQCGKLIVATNSLERKRLHDLYQRCEQNDLSPTLLSKSMLLKKSPNTLGEEAIFIAQTGIVDYQTLTTVMLNEFLQLGGDVTFNFPLIKVEQLQTSCDLLSHHARINSGFVINCTGVMTDRIATMFDLELDFRIVPFKGEYFQLPAKYNQIIDHLIYPVPDPSLPFLGVHLTKMIDGSVTVGPNAVLAAAREGYHKFDFNLTDMAASFTFPGFWRLLNRHKSSVWGELKSSLSKREYLKQVHKYCPQIKYHELLPYRSGIRAQAVAKDGALIHDFKFIQTNTSLHVCNAPSPAATSAIPIASEIVNRIENQLNTQN